MLWGKVPVLSIFINYVQVRVLPISAHHLVALSPIWHKRGSEGRGEPGDQSVIRW